MRILYIDIDSLRPDHLGCYGYHRATSPVIDGLAAEATRFTNCTVTDAPCLPSRSALWSGRCGFHTGVVGHGGTAGEPMIEGPGRGFRDRFGNTGWMSALCRAGLRTVTVSPFGERHGAWHWYAGFNEIYNTGGNGGERADEIGPVAVDWIARNGASDDWFLHVNFWDPHTPYRTPEDFGNPFDGAPLPEWITEQVRQRCWEGFGPHSAQEPLGWGHETSRFPRVPGQLDSMDSVRRWIDGYDVGVRYADEHVGHLLEALERAGVLDETVIIVGADHGENLGELNVWGDHQTADPITCNVPLIVRWPGVTDGGRVDEGLLYHYDWAATLIEMLGGEVPESWDGRSFTDAFQAGETQSRPYVIASQNAWSCQRGVRFGDWLCLRTYHDGYKELDPVMLFHVADDPHEQTDLSEERPDVVHEAMAYLADWYHDMALTGTHDTDPMMTVLREGGPFHTRGQLSRYARRLRETGRAKHAERLENLHPGEL